MFQKWQFKWVVTGCGDLIEKGYGKHTCKGGGGGLTAVIQTAEGGVFSWSRRAEGSAAQGEHSHSLEVAHSCNRVCMCRVTRALEPNGHAKTAYGKLSTLESDMLQLFE